MNPRGQLVLSVVIIAAVIVAAWVVLFRNHALAPPVAMPAGPSLPEISKQFDKEIEQFNRLLEPTISATGGSASGGNGAPATNGVPIVKPKAASDDPIAPAP